MENQISKEACVCVQRRTCRYNFIHIRMYCEYVHTYKARVAGHNTPGGKDNKSYTYELEAHVCNILAHSTDF